MFELIQYILVFLIAFFILIKSADKFVDEASTIGKKMGISKLTIGLTIVAIGTSLPEMITSLASIFFTENYSDFVIGTTMGSNITNILLAFGLFLVFAPTFTTKKREIMNVVFLVFTTLVLTFHILIGFVSPIVIVLAVLYFTYLFYLAKFQEKELLGEEKDVVDIQKHSIQTSFLYLILSFAGLYLGARFVIYSVEGAGSLLGIPTAYLTLTTISIATSLPELAVTITSARKKEYMVAIGNILGTNVMNVCLILGISGVFGTYLIDTSLYIYSLIFFLVGTLIFSYLVLRRKFTPFWGYIFLTMYIFYFGVFLI